MPKNSPLVIARGPGQKGHFHDARMHRFYLRHLALWRGAVPETIRTSSIDRDVGDGTTRCLPGRQSRDQLERGRTATANADGGGYGAMDIVIAKGVPRLVVTSVEEGVALAARHRDPHSPFASGLLLLLQDSFRALCLPARLNPRVTLNGFDRTDANLHIDARAEAVENCD